MNRQGDQLGGLLRSVRGRRRVLLVLRGAAVCLCVGALSLLLMGWAAHRYRQSEAAVVALRFGALAVFLATAYLSLLRPLLKRIGDARLARLIEERTPGASDRLVTAVEFADGGQERGASAAILNRLAADADQVAATIRPEEVIGRRPLVGYGLACAGCLLLFAAVLRFGPGSISQGVAQLVTPSSLASSNNTLRIQVKPGTARVPKGSDQEITATLSGFDSQQVTIFSRPVGPKGEGGGASEWQAQAMEPGKELQRFQFSIFNIQESVEYYVEAGQVRTEVFRLDVVDLPFVKQLDLLLNFPAYTRISAKTIEDGGDIAALKGTVATVTARLTGKARAARLVLADGRKVEMRAEGQGFVGSLTVTADTSYYVELVSMDGEAYRGSNEYDISVLEDAPPTIAFERPGRDTKATNLEEVFTQARAEDDYGVSSVEMFFSVNGGQEQKINLQEFGRDAQRSLTAAHTFFLEELKLKPGDFISYYARARDASNETTSDIYFIEIKPFEMQYKQSQQGGGGGSGGGEDQNALTRRQKELIAATHRLTREGSRYAPQERADAYETVAAGQEKLRTDTLEFLDRLGRRLGQQLEGAESLARMAEHLRQAAREMEGAPPPLRKQLGRDALPAEQRALQQLLSADAIFRELQVAFGNQQGGAGGGERESRELTDLFELELDKMKNQYETLQREQRAERQRGKSEAERKLEELARRQQKALEGQRRQQAQARNSSSGGGSSSSGGNQRQQQELIEETRRTARELERLSRERRDAQLQELSRQLNQAANEMQQSQASSQSNSSESIAEGQRALERLEQARRSLQQGGGSAGRQQEITELRRRAAEAAARQREIAKDVESLARRGAQSSQGSAGSQDQATRSARQRLGERKGALADAVSNLEQDMEQQARALGASDGRAARQLSEAASSLRRDRVAERIREGQREVENGRMEQARAGERSIERSLNELSERLQAAEQNAGRSAGGSNGEETLERTRRLADSLESLRRRMDEQGRRREARAERGEQPGRQSGEQSGEQGSSSSGQQQSAEQRDGGGAEGDARQLGSELRQRLSDAADLRRAWGASGGVQLDRAIEELRRMADGSMRGDAQTAASLKSQVIDPLRQLELELSRRLREQAGRTNLRLGDEGSAPERYRRSVEEYYRRLSGGRQR
ncbi:MAG TPA: DUF4175 family protein [Pyrinomonadaceae bacterium]|jgi:hypothetical protein